MAEYIDRNALLEALCKNDPSHMEDYYYHAIKDFPQADVVPVVRCQDCEHYYKGHCVHGRNELEDRAPMDFCNYGEAKEG